jgi:curved DNA-binding protein CbpA
LLKLKDYYKVLNLSSTASSEEIKKSYRKLALQFHPDRNPSPQAKAIFQEINEAYNVLSDPVKRNYYDIRLKNSYQPNPSSGFQRPQNTKERYQTYHQTFRKKKVRVKDPYKSYAQKGVFFSSFIFFFCLILCLDYLISQRYDSTIVEDISSYGIKTFRYVDHYSHEVKSSKLNFNFNSESVIPITLFDTVNVEITPIFGIVKSCCLASDQKHNYANSFSIYYPFTVLILMTMGASVASLTVKSSETGFSLTILSVFLFIIIQFLLAKS